jgi:hypothetical protein
MTSIASISMKLWCQLSHYSIFRFEMFWIWPKLIGIWPTYGISLSRYYDQWSTADSQSLKFLIEKEGRSFFQSSNGDLIYCFDNDLCMVNEIRVIRDSAKPFLFGVGWSYLFNSWMFVCGYWNKIANHHSQRSVVLSLVTIH